MKLSKRIEKFKMGRTIKRFKKFNFPEEMINDLNEYFDEHYGMVEFYLPYPMGKGIENTRIYRIFKKYDKEKILINKKIYFPIMITFGSDIHYRLNLGD